MSESAAPDWSEDAGQAGWIGERLAPFSSYQVTSVVPGGYEAYARVLHPAEAPRHDRGRVVRWAEVAAWSGLPLRPDSQFHSVALPPERPVGEAPWSGQGPRAGSLYLADAEVLAAILRTWTVTPERCWFCVWDGYGWDRAVFVTARRGAKEPAPAEPPARRGDPIPASVRQGRRVVLPQREYLLYAGPVEAAMATVGLGGDDQVANLWWPADRAWCVASEIDLPWTYVGGPAGLIGQLLADQRLEVLPAGLADAVNRVEDWVAAWAAQAARSLLSAGEDTIATSRGTLQAWLQRPDQLRPGLLRTHVVGDNGVTSDGQHLLRGRDEADLPETIRRYLIQELIGLVGG